MVLARWSPTFYSGRIPDLQLFSRTTWLGSQTTTVFISWQIGGGRNIDHHILHVAVDVIKESRELRLQPFNEYRKRFGMKPYTSFQELTGEQLLPDHDSCPPGAHADVKETLRKQNGMIHGPMWPAP